MRKAAEFTGEELIAEMRSMLRPQGTADLVRLFLGGSCYIETAQVAAAIDTLEAAMTKLTPLNPLESIGVEVLLASIYVTR